MFDLRPHQVPALALSFLIFGCASAPQKAALGCAAFDWLTTYHGMQNGFVEANPVLSVAGSDDTALVTGALVSVGFHLMWTKTDFPPVGWKVYAGGRCAVGAYNLYVTER